MKCPSCGRENPATSIRCSQCRTALFDASDDRTMDSPATTSGSTHGDTKPAAAESDLQSSTLVRTPSGATPSETAKMGMTRSGAFDRCLKFARQLCEAITCTSPTSVWAVPSLSCSVMMFRPSL